MKLLAFAIKYITLWTRSSPRPCLARHQGNAEEGLGLKRIRFCLLLCTVKRIITSADNFICYCVFFFLSALQLKDFSGFSTPRLFNRNRNKAECDYEIILF